MGGVCIAPFLLIAMMIPKVTSNITPNMMYLELELVVVPVLAVPPVAVEAPTPVLAGVDPKTL